MIDLLLIALGLLGIAWTVSLVWVVWSYLDHQAQESVQKRSIRSLPRARLPRP